jgi:hypothetical protein
MSTSVTPWPVPALETYLQNRFAALEAAVALLQAQVGALQAQVLYRSTPVTPAPGSPGA